MNRASIIAPLAVGTLAVGALLASLSFAEPPKDAAAGKPSAGAPPEMPLPPGWTKEDMQTCVLAGTPGDQHKWLARQVGTWNGKVHMWMGPTAKDPMHSECTQVVSSAMEGRFIRFEMAGEMPGMGTFMGMGVSGFDNVSGNFVGSWLDNHNTGIMQGTGTVSKDGKVLTWSYGYNCPLTKKPTKMREIQTWTGDNAMTTESFVIDPKSGKEYQCMKIEFTRKP
ncbi:MAG: DUF1579 domain-containing protein [Phycisphaerales bacterium]